MSCTRNFVVLELALYSLVAAYKIAYHESVPESLRRSVYVHERFYTTLYVRVLTEVCYIDCSLHVVKCATRRLRQPAPCLSILTPCTRQRCSPAS